GVRVGLRGGRILRYPDNDTYGFDVGRLAPLFHRTRCSLCFDLVNDLADVAVGDAPTAHAKESYVVIRTAEALRLVREAEEARHIRLSEAAPDEFRLAVLKKKRRAFTLLQWMRDKGLPSIETDFSYDLARDYPWSDDGLRRDMLLLRELARTEIGRRLFANLPRNVFARDVGLAFLGWKE
ncbi:MAG: Coenzyme F420 hydrogenase/dehydrogenase, beta subunit C-terminal domain, partial [Planctomycetota bacterium]